MTPVNKARGVSEQKKELANNYAGRHAGLW